MTFNKGRRVAVAGAHDPLCWRVAELLLRRAPLVKCKRITFGTTKSGRRPYWSVALLSNVRVAQKVSE